MNMNIHHVSTSVVSSEPGQLGSTSSAPALSGSSSLLPPPVPLSIDGDLGAEVAALAVQQGQVEQTLDTNAAEAEDASESAADAAQVSTLHQEASTMRAGAWGSGMLQISAGACSIASAVTSMNAAAGTPQAAAAGTLKGTSEGLIGGGALADGLSKASATDTQALATGQKALSDAAQRAGDAARDAQKSSASFVQAALDFFREYESTKSQAQAAAIHGA